MSIEDRVRRVLTDAVATEPPPRRAPLAAVRRRRRRRPVLAGAVAVVLVLAAVIGLAARPAGWCASASRAGGGSPRPTRPPAC